MSVAVFRPREPAVDPFSAVIARGDFWRRAPGAGPFREWSHFCLFASELHLLINFNITQRPDGAEIPRVVALARLNDGEWDGDAEQFEPGQTRVPGGRIAADIGRSRLRYRDGAYELRLQLEKRPIDARLRLRPCTRPALTSSIPLGTHAMQWFVVPRLEAEGVVRVGNQDIRVDGALAYHDHDWGEFSWRRLFLGMGGRVAARSRLPMEPDFPADLGSSADQHLVSRVDALEGADHFRTLHEGAVTTISDGTLSARSALRVPRVMSLVSPGRAADLPRCLEVRARRGNDVIEMQLELSDLAQVAYPTTPTSARQSSRNATRRRTLPVVYAARRCGWTGRPSWR